jgi:GNAT superfamily N-acetyltransferase
VTHRTDNDVDYRVDRHVDRATRADAQKISELIAVAFHALDVSAWLVPDPALRLRRLVADFRIFVDHALEHGEIHLIRYRVNKTESFPIAAAVWFPQLTQPAPAPPDYEARLEAACGPATGRFRVLDEHFEDTHPQVFPHHHLAYLAARPHWQSRGLGAALLDHHHRELDHRGIPAFLHASCARTRDFYQRSGYQPLGEPFRLPDGPQMWPMWREPGDAA